MCNELVIGDWEEICAKTYTIEATILRSLSQNDSDFNLLKISKWRNYAIYVCSTAKIDNHIECESKDDKIIEPINSSSTSNRIIDKNKISNCRFHTIKEVLHRLSLFLNNEIELQREATILALGNSNPSIQSLVLDSIHLFEVNVFQPNLGKLHILMNY